MRNFATASRVRMPPFPPRLASFLIMRRLNELLYRANDCSRIFLVEICAFYTPTRRMRPLTHARHGDHGSRDRAVRRADDAAVSESLQVISSSSTCTQPYLARDGKPTATTRRVGHQSVATERSSRRGQFDLANSCRPLRIFPEHLARVAANSVMLLRSFWSVSELFYCILDQVIEVRQNVLGLRLRIV
jgi:hypothetical protein